AFLFVSDQCGKPAITPARDANDRIYGGREAIPGSWPWQAQVYEGSHICGGVLITDQHVLTAAHCVWGRRPSALTIYLGAHYRSQAQKTDVAVKIEEICVHPASYETKTPGAIQDIAIIKLKRKVNTTRTIQPVCLPDHGEQLATGTKLYVTGWGAVGVRWLASGLKQAMVSAISHRDCRRIRPHIIPQVFCAGHGSGSACGGDSGSPVVRFANDKWTLHGLVSAGPAICGARFAPQMYTKVSAYIDTFVGPYVDPRTSRQKIRDICIIRR
ncbi:unnamed protein product, partial [Ixodes hexagonus]